MPVTHFLIWVTDSLLGTVAGNRHTWAHFRVRILVAV